MHDPAPATPIRAISLLSGGLDSQLAVAVLKAQGIAVHGLTFRSLFFEARAAERAARTLDIPLTVEDFTPTILGLIARPRHGFGAGLNPCIDCHIAMVRRAGDLMRDQGAQFVSTGEVLNQRPMSQHRVALRQVAEESGVGDWLLRPLSARLLPDTEPERRGWVDRARLLDFHGRTRRPQEALARQFGIADYPQPAGGCLLTDPLYGQRLRELKDHEGLGDARLIRRLRLGRHFRIGAHRLVVGRNRADNESLARDAGPEDWVLQARDVQGPLALFPAAAAEADLRRAAAVCARYSDRAPLAPVVMTAHRGGQVLTFEVTPAAPAEAEALRL